MTADDNREPLMFNSQSFGDILGKPQFESVPNPSPDLLKQIAFSIRSIFGLTIFGFDVIRDSASGDYVIIDINYFPGLSSVRNFHSHLLTHITTSLSKPRGPSNLA